MADPTYSTVWGEWQPAPWWMQCEEYRVGYRLTRKPDADPNRVIMTFESYIERRGHDEVPAARPLADHP